jgi:hypothetical protein
MEKTMTVQRELHFKSVAKSKKAVIFCSNPVSKADVDRVNKLRDNKLNGKVNTGDTTMQFGKLKARGYSALPNFGVNYFVPMDVSKHKAADLPKVGDTFTLDVVVKEQEDGTLVDARPVINRKTGKPVTNCYWASLPKA